MGGSFDRITGQVRRFLEASFADIETEPDGTWTFPQGSTRVSVKVDHGDGHSVVSVWAYTNYRVPNSPELFQYIATHADTFRFGHLGAHENGDGTVDVVFSCRILGDSLDEDELEAAVQSVATTADDLDDTIRDDFGGRRHADVNRRGEKGGGP